MGAILSTNGVDNLGTHKFSHRGSSRETVAECISVDFRKVLKPSTLRKDSEISQWREALHALIALYNTCLPNITPELLYSTVCTKDARSLMLVMSPEAALEDLCFRYGATSVLESLELSESPAVTSSSESPFSAGGDRDRTEGWLVGYPGFRSLRICADLQDFCRYVLIRKKLTYSETIKTPQRCQTNIKNV